MNLKRSSFSIIVIFFCLSILGISLLPKLTLKLVPSQNYPTVSVSFSMLGQSPRVVEEKVTSRIESMLNRIEGVKEIRSTSNNGWGNIYISTDKNSDMDAIRFEVANVIRELWAQLPEGVSYPRISIGSYSNEVNTRFLTYTLNAPSEPFFIYKYAKKHIEPALASIDGLAKVEISGATPMEWQLEYDIEQLNQLGVSVNDIRTAIQQSLNENFLGMGNYKSDNNIKENYLSLICRTKFYHNFKPEQILVKKTKGKLVYLNQIVKITYKEQEPRSYFRINGLNSIYITMYAEEDANQIKTAAKAKEVLASLQQYFPPGYELHKSRDRTEYIRQELYKIRLRSMVTVLILLLFVLLISRNFKYVLLIIISLLCNFLIASIVYYFLRIEFQMYSLAAITISLALIIGSIIMMTEHVINRKNFKVFTAIVGATLCTIAVLIIIFLIEDDRLKFNMLDFAYVLVINLSISLLVVLFLVPALIDRLEINFLSSFSSKSVQRLIRRRKRIISINRKYERFLNFSLRRKWLLIIFVILLFGTPIFLLPQKIEKKNIWGNMYNKTLGSQFYKQTLSSYVNIFLGGTWRLFNETSAKQSSSSSNNSETRISITASMPNGATLKEMNGTVREMEAFITTFKGVKQFETSINSPQNAHISISFTPKAEKEGLPHYMKSELISKALLLGNASWRVSGVGQGFSNDLTESTNIDFLISMKGYNYDELMLYATKLKKRLLTHNRIKEVLIVPKPAYYKNNYKEYLFSTNPTILAKNNLTISNLYNSIYPIFIRNQSVARTTNAKGGTENINLLSKQFSEYDIWSIKRYPQNISRQSIKLGDIAKIEKEQAPKSISKINQQYQLYLQYQYIGVRSQGMRILNNDVDFFTKQLPIGYFIKNEQRNWYWEQKSKTYYSLILIVIAIIYIICSIFFNSFVRPLAIILIVPISYIGVFLSFILLKIPFGQGGFAAFLLLSGLNVGSAFYLMSDYDFLCKLKKTRGKHIYIKSLNRKIIPVLLTILSIILGFVPFLIGMENNPFWKSLALGTIGGLLFSIVSLFVYLPLFTLFSSKTRKNLK